MTDLASDSPAGPYAEAAAIYWAAGWAPLPLPARSKKPVPRGWTGATGAWPSYPDVQAWIDGSEGAGNLALRLSRHVIGIDVDDYGDKQGGVTLETLETQWGELPATWRSSSRERVESGIRLYTVPEGLAWPSEPGPAIEIIQFGHRYVVAWPSVHPEGGTYRWYSPDGAVVINQVPQVDELPALPDAWITGLTGGALREDVARADYTALETASWLATYGQGALCRSMTRATERYVNELGDAGLSRHGVALRATARLVRMVAEGHRGGLDALGQVMRAFDAAVDRTPARETDPKEWARLLDGAVQLAAVDAVAPADPCDDPFAALIVGSNTWTASAPTATTPSTGTSPSAPASGAGAPSDEQPPSSTRDQALAEEMAREWIRREARRQLDTEEAAKSFREPVWARTLTEELALPDEEVRFTVSDLLPTGANALLIAQFKAGKTTMVNNLTRSLVDVQPFLGRHAVRGEHRVGIFNYEVGRGQYRRWLRDEGIENTDRVTVLNLRGYQLPLTSPRIADWIVNWLIEHGTTCWVLDPFARAFVGSGSENDNSDVGRFLEAIDVIKERAGVSELVMPTHTGRMTQEAGAERARGATRLDDWADVRWLLTTDDEQARFFRATGRDVEVAEGQLHYDVLSRHLSIGDGQRKGGKQGHNTAADIMSIVRQQPGVSGRGVQTALREANVGRRPEVVNAEVDKLVTKGRLRRDGYSLYVQEDRFSDVIPEVIPSPISADSQPIPLSDSPGPVRGPGITDSGITSDEVVSALPPLTRDQRVEQGQALRGAVARGARPEITFEGTVVDTSTGELIWSPPRSAS